VHMVAIFCQYSRDAEVDVGNVSHLWTFWRVRRSLVLNLTNGQKFHFITFEIVTTSQMCIMPQFQNVIKLSSS
jgi:hypothetical protein